MPDDPIVAVSRVSKKGLVQIPLEIREKLDLKPGTRMIIVTADDVVVLQKAEVLVAREGSRGIMHRLKSIFSKVPIRNIEG